MVNPNDIDVKSYRDYAVRGGFMGRGLGIWAFSTLGLAAGAAFGLLIPMFPALAGAELVAGFLWKSVAIFAATGMTAGFGAALVVGPAAGAAADVAKEHERRLLAHEAEMGLPVSAQGMPASKIAPQKYFNGKVAIMMAAAGMIGGAVMFASFMAFGGIAGGAALSIPGLSTLVAGSSITNTVVGSFLIGGMGLFGSLWGVNFPQLTYKMSDIAGQYIGGQAIDASWDLPKEPQKAMQKQVTHEPARHYESTVPVYARRATSFREMLEQQGEASQATQR